MNTSKAQKEFSVQATSPEGHFEAAYVWKGLKAAQKVFDQYVKMGWTARIVAL